MLMLMICAPCLPSTLALCRLPDVTARMHRKIFARQLRQVFHCQSAPAPGQYYLGQLLDAQNLKKTLLFRTAHRYMSADKVK